MVYFLMLLFIIIVMTFVNISNLKLKEKFDKEIEDYKKANNAIVLEHRKTMEELKMKEILLNNLVDNSQKLIQDYDIIMEILCEEVEVEKIDRLIIEKKMAKKPKDLNEFIKKVKEEKQ